MRAVIRILYIQTQKALANKRKIKGSSVGMQLTDIHLPQIKGIAKIQEERLREACRSKEN